MLFNSSRKVEDDCIKNESNSRRGSKFRYVSYGGSQLRRNPMVEIKNNGVAEKFGSYPDKIGKKLLFLRQLILDTASELNDIDGVEETLKWGEPGYVTKSGSTIRIDWKESKPNQYAMYFNCNTKLVDTFRELYPGQFKFEGNRAIVFGENDEIPVNELKHCISLSLTYHRIKHLPMLGV